MPTYVIEGKTVKTDNPLSEAEIDEIGTSIRGSTSNPSPKPETKEPSLGEYLLNKAKSGLTNAISGLAAGSAANQGTMGGAFPAQPELDSISAGGIQKSVFGVRSDLKAPAVNVPGYGKTDLPTRTLGAAVEAVTDPVSYVYPGSLLTKGTNAAISGTFSELGGEAGAATEVALTGRDSGTGRAIGSVGGAIAGPTGTVGSKTVVNSVGNVSGQLWEKYKTVKIDPQGAVDNIAAGSAKRLLEHAAKAEGVSKIDDILANVKVASQYVTGKDAPLLVAMSENPILKEQIVRLAKTNPEYRARLQKELDSVAQAIDRKANVIFGERYAAVPADKGLKVDNVQKRITAIDGQLERLTDPMSAASTRTDIGEAVQNLVEARKTAVRERLSPEYEYLKAEAAQNGVKLPAEASEELYTFVKANRLQDIFGRGTPVDNKILSTLGVGKDAKGLEVRSFREMSFDDVDSLKREINRLQRTVKDPTQQMKLTQLEDFFDTQRQRHIPEWSDRLKAIDQRYYEELGVPFGAQGVKDIDSAKYASRVAPVIVNNRQSFRDFMRVAGDDGIQVAENAILSKAYESAVKDGFVSSPALTAFIKKNREVLDEPQMSRVRELLTNSLADNNALRAERARIEVAAKEAQKRVADNFLTSTGEPNYSNLLTGVLNDPRQRAKVLKDIKDLSPDTAEAVRGAMRAELANRTLNNPQGAMAFLTDRANKAGIEALMGTGYQESLKKIGLLSDHLRKADISKLSVELERSQLDAVGKIVPGLDLPYVTSTVRDRISSTTQKAVRLLTRVNTAQAQSAFDKQMMELLTDPQGVQKLARVATDLNFKIRNPVELKKVLSTLLDSMPANVYIGFQNSEEE